MIAEWFQALQDEICKALEKEDGEGKFIEDNWQRAEGGGGRTRVIKNGKVIEKGGVNFSAVHGEVPSFLKNDHTTTNLDNHTFYATGVSIVIHPNNPMVPIIHMNVRYFEMSNGVWWFGGGIDLTPHYVNKQDAKYFHTQLKNTCDKHDVDYYPAYKKWADDYFFISHRNETRGIGGIFFDRLNKKSKQEIFAFVQEVGKTFAPTYVELMNKNKEKKYTEENKKWQYLRRGRYVEFNLVYDKGTKFGLETNGRIESILMSLPQTASWEYNHLPIQNSEEHNTLNCLKKGIDWV